MNEEQNFLLGFGERLVDPIANPPRNPGTKSHPYTLDESLERLSQALDGVTETLQDLPSLLCPRDEVVALLTLHPAYLAKSYYPQELLSTFDLETVGGRSARIAPTKRASATAPEHSITTEFFVAGRRSAFRHFADAIPNITESMDVAEDIIKIENIRLQTNTEKTPSLPALNAESQFIEIVLHAQNSEEKQYVIEGFWHYLQSLNIETMRESRRFYTDGLCFLPIRATKEQALEVAKYSFLRVARKMPSLRRFTPCREGSGASELFPVILPTHSVLSNNINVAVFDGGVEDGGPLSPWVTLIEPHDIMDPDPESVSHGTAVTSALLFGPISEGIPLPVPFSRVDHIRVLDVLSVHEDGPDDPPLYKVLGRIEDQLTCGKQYDFINLSIGPDIPIDDTDVNTWTAVLDRLLCTGDVLATIAAGNTEGPDLPDNHSRIQPPADCVNALAIGSCDRTDSKWAPADYSAIGPGRCPGIIKPDGVGFGGSDEEPFGVLSSAATSSGEHTIGTSFAAPSVLRTAVGLRAHFGSDLSPLAIRALLIHSADSAKHPTATAGWGRFSDDIHAIATSDGNTAHILYNCDIGPREWMRIRIPVPAGLLTGSISIGATFCYSTPIDPQDPANYTRCGLDIIFRPDRNALPKPNSIYPKSEQFFQKSDYSTESELRKDAHKWETVLHKMRRKQARTLNEPVFDVHYNSRFGGRDSRMNDRITFALVLTLSSTTAEDLYDQIVRANQTILQPIRPVIDLPIRV